MTNIQNIAYDLRTIGYALAPEPEGLSANLEKAYAIWTGIFSSKAKYALPKNDKIPSGYFSFSYPGGFDMKENFYYHMATNHPPKPAAAITNLLVQQFLTMVRLTAGSISAD